MKPRLRLRLLLAALATPALSASAAEPALKADLSCRPEAAPGRVLCELSCQATGNARLAWLDALVTSAPDFARPLRSRITPERFQDTAGRERKLSLGFIATRPGSGEVSVRARAVICRGEQASERCEPETRLVRAELRVGG